MGDQPKAEQNGQESMSRYWFGDFLSDRPLPAESDPSLLLTRFHQYHTTMNSQPSWKDAVVCGFCRDQDEYLAILRDFCMLWSQDEIRRHNSSKEAQLLKLVLILRETDTMLSRLSEQISSWNGMVGHISDERAPGIDESYLVTGGPPGSDGVSLLTRDLGNIRVSRSRLARDIAARSEDLLPNCSALVGPLVAARVCSAAGGLHHLAQMPGCAIQILGAKNAFFSHRSSGSPPPKHGLIFEHKRVHAAPKQVRGRVSRTLAANLAIAARIDYYRGTIDHQFITKADMRIKQAGQRS